jgi:putative FmdB family regulatory protein
MPLYEYRCRACGHEFEVLTRAADADAVACQACASRKVTRLLSTFAVHGAAAAAPEPGPCGACGAPERGICGRD